MSEDRVLHRGADGTPLFAYHPGGPRTAFDVEVFDDAAIGAILSEMPGWTVSGPPGLGGALVARGAAPRRHFTVMNRDLAADPPPPEWSDPDLGRGLRAAPCDRDPREVFGAWRAAYSGPDHPDRFGGDDEGALAERLAPLLLGREGSVLPWSRLALGPDRRVLAGAVAIDVRRLGPWIGDVWRDPAPELAGAGAAVLRHALALAAASGVTDVGLSVTYGNPARRVYDRLGFTELRELVTVAVP